VGWQQREKKYHLVSWRHICRPRSKGGLGMKYLTKFNISLMFKWWWRLEKEKGPWQDFMWRKYMPNASQGQNNSVLWSEMLHINDIYLSWRKMLIGD
jgi:hypothetical protein